MPNLNFQFEDDHTRVDVDYGLLTGGGLNICLLQLPATVDEALEDLSRPLAVSVLRDLLVGAQPALQQMVAGLGPALIVAPEYALGSDDWIAVDAIVREANRPLVLVAGFGATHGQAVLDWQAGANAGGTERHLAWQQAHHPISTAMRVNGGWCWIHEPNGTTHCIAYLKNHLEQAVEAVQIPDLQLGGKFLHLRFADLDLLPLICADLLQPAALYPASPQARMQRMLRNLVADRPTLVVGSLLQIGFNHNWATAIDSVLNTVLAGRSGLVALCNVAHDVPVADEIRDKWRSLTGVFAPYHTIAHGQANLPAVRALNAQGIAGAVVRQTHPSVTAGMVAWQPYNPVNGKFVWRGNMVSPISAQGISAPIVAAPSMAACEIARFLRRYPVDPGTAPRVAAGTSEISEQLLRPSPPIPETLLTSTLNGTLLKDRVDPDQIDSVEVISALKPGLHALATLKSIDGIEWQANPRMAGQLRIDAQDRHLLVWRSATGSPGVMRRDLAAWMLSGGEHPHLVVLGSTPLGDLRDGEIKDDRRDDISVAPTVDTDLGVGGSLASFAGDITAAKGMRRVAGLGLSQVAQVYADYDAAEDNERVTTLLARIGAFFQEGIE
ncbi:ABC-three component system protein [Aquipseudomonas alcaligenes]|nr:ABC-three component system protein [Pseudomonas alcaligenes]